MKKLNIPKYIVRTKWLIIVAVILFLLVFGRVINSPTLTKTAIVLGAGIDYSKEKQEFIVSTQSIIMASSSMQSNSQTTYETYTCTGKTIAAAMDDISQKMGLIVSLAHCNVLILSQEALKLDHLQLIFPLTGMYALREQTIVVATDRSPDELLSLRVGTTISAPYFLQSAISNKEGSDGLIRTTVKDMLARSLSRSQATAIPYITASEMQDQPIDQQGEQKGNYELDLSRTLVFNHTDSQIIEEDLSEILAIYLSGVSFGSVNYAAETGETVEFRILDKDVSSSAKGRNVKIEIELTVDMLDVQFIETDEVLTGASEQIKKAAEGLAKQLEERMRKLYELSKEYNIDFLNLQSKVYQSVGRDLEENCLGTIAFEPTVKIEVKEAA